MSGRATRLASLEEPLSFVAGDRLVKEPLFRPRVIQIVVDDVVAEGLTCHRTALELLDRLSKRRGYPRQALVRISVPLEHWRGLDRVLEPVQACRDHGGEGEVRVA